MLDVYEYNVSQSRMQLFNEVQYSLFFNYRNDSWYKGTHEEENCDDFDAEHVESIIATLEALDALDLRHGRWTVSIPPIVRLTYPDCKFKRSKALDSDKNLRRMSTGIRLSASG